jgi:Tol biopolymer transport system component
MKKILFLLLLGFNSFIYAQKAQEFPVLKGDYFGQTPPGDAAVIFAPGIISRTDRAELKIAFSPDGNECYFYADGSNGVGIYYTKRVNNTWTEQVIAPFSLNHVTTDPFFSADGKRLYFTYNTTDWSGGDIWFVERTKEGWGEPQLLPSPINSDFKDWSYTETTDGVAYIQSNRPGGFGGFDIWRIGRLSNLSLKAENLGPIINSTGMDLSPCIAPDGSYLIFSSVRPGAFSIQDLYICFNKGDTGWTDPVNMEITGARINIAGYNQVCPSLSPDGKFLFFCNHAQSGDKRDIYWVSTKVIDDIKKEVFNPKGTK